MLFYSILFSFAFKLIAKIGWYYNENTMQATHKKQVIKNKNLSIRHYNVVI